MFSTNRTKFIFLFFTMIITYNYIQHARFKVISKSSFEYLYASTSKKWLTQKVNQRRWSVSYNQLSDHLLYLSMLTLAAQIIRFHNRSHHAQVKMCVRASNKSSKPPLVLVHFPHKDQIMSFMH